MLMFFLHGFGGHINGPTILNMSAVMKSEGIAVLCLDMPGHGYSDGERALIVSHTRLVEDFERFVEIFLSDDSSVLEHILTINESIKADMVFLRKLPFFVVGQSMGGAVTALSSNGLLKYKNYLGSVMLAPALQVASPGRAVVEILRLTVGFFAPSALMPPWMTKTTDNRASFKDENTIMRAEMDTWGRPGALGWNQGMRWASALMFLDMADAITSMLPGFKFPFLIIHDPDDQVCSVDGSRQMLSLSETPLDLKTMIEVPGYLHALLTNYNDEICAHILKWAKGRAEFV